VGFIEDGTGIKRFTTETQKTQRGTEK